MPGEACDDGNQVSGDGCSATCGVETGFVCSPEDLLTRSEVASEQPQRRTECVPVCGDGLVLKGEQCDVGGLRRRERAP